jgi:FAD synthase
MNKIFSGKILYGKQLGRTIGFPTANIHVEAGKLLPCTYGVSVDIE